MTKPQATLYFDIAGTLAASLSGWWYFNFLSLLIERSKLRIRDSTTWETFSWDWNFSIRSILSIFTTTVAHQACCRITQQICDISSLLQEALLSAGLLRFFRYELPNKAFGTLCPPVTETPSVPSFLQHPTFTPSQKHREFANRAALSFGEHLSVIRQDIQIKHQRKSSTLEAKVPVL